MENGFDGSYFGVILKEKVAKESNIWKMIEKLDEQRKKRHYFIESDVLDYILKIKEKMSNSLSNSQEYYRARIIKKNIDENNLKEFMKYQKFLEKLAYKVIDNARKDNRNASTWEKILNWIEDNDLSDLGGENNKWEYYDRYEEYVDNYKCDFSGFREKEADAPPCESASEGRVNYGGISYLYLANKVETAIWEVKPQVGDLISVATFDINKKYKIFDVTYPTSVNECTDIDDCILFDKLTLSTIFSRPLSESRGKYWITQYISEYISTIGFDGIMFTSSITGGENLVLFDSSREKGNYSIINSSIYRIDKNLHISKILPVDIY